VPAGRSSVLQLQLQAYLAKNMKQKPTVQVPGPTRFVVYAGGLLKQSLSHYAVAWCSNAKQVKQS
jgi:hypothetical protein